MTLDVATVAEDLAKLQKGRGLQAADLSARVGPALSQATGFAVSRGAEGRRSLTRQLVLAAGGLSPDLSLVFARACALRLDDGPTLGVRLDVAARHIKRSREATRRRVTQANLIVASRLVDSAKGDQGWILHSLRCFVDLRESSPVYRADYSLVVTAPTLHRISEKISLPGSGDAEPEFAVSGSAHLEAVTRIHPQTWECSMSLDRDYSCGDVIRYRSAVRLPRRADAPPMSVMAPRRDCRFFSTTVRLGGLADQVWVLDGVTPPTVNDEAPTGSRIDPAVDPQPSVEFRNLVPGVVYGLRWTWKAGPE